MNFIDRLEKRYPNFGVSNLMIYVIAISGLGMLISMVNPYIYYQYLSLDFYQIFHHGQVWRLITFLLCPSAGGSGSSGLFWFVIMAWVYYSIGSNLERIWGRFRFTLFYLSGIVMILVVTLAAYLIMGIVYPAQEVGIWLGMQVTLEYVTESLFLAFALDAYQIIQGIMMKSYYPVALIVVSLINIFIFFFFAKGRPGMAAHARQTKRKAEFKQKMHESREKGPIHRCAICGRTELDAPELDFRYCSKCDGRYEYCSEHLFTHEHVHHK